MTPQRETLQDALINNLPYGPKLVQAIRDWPNEEIQQLNTIVDFFEFKCGGPWTVYIETALPALGELAIALLDFGWDDVARGFLRPYGIRNRLKFRIGRKRKRRRLRAEIPELGELIGENLPGAKIIKGRNIGKLQRWLWKIDAVAQEALWWWMVIDLSTDLFYNWTSGIMKSADCYSGAAWGLLSKEQFIGFPAGVKDQTFGFTEYEVVYGTPPIGIGWMFNYASTGQIFASATLTFSAGIPGCTGFSLKVAYWPDLSSPKKVVKQGITVENRGINPTATITYRPTRPGWYGVLMDTEGAGTAGFNMVGGAYGEL